MSRYLSWLILLPLVAIGPGRSQEAKKGAPGTNDVEVHFLDGSAVRMTILQESLEVATKYGKLTIPTRDIRRIEFGVHLADGLGRKIEALVNDLGSRSFHDREAAGKQLLTLGPKAYAALVEGLRSKDPEVTQRAQALVKKLREQFT